MTTSPQLPPQRRNVGAAPPRSRTDGELQKPAHTYDDGNALADIVLQHPPHEVVTQWVKRIDFLVEGDDGAGILDEGQTNAEGGPELISDHKGPKQREHDLLLLALGEWREVGKH